LVAKFASTIVRKVLRFSDTPPALPGKCAYLKNLTKRLSWLTVYETGEREGVEFSKLSGAENLRL
jgi:hypothetical protein